MRIALGLGIGNNAASDAIARLLAWWSGEAGLTAASTITVQDLETEGTLTGVTRATGIDDPDGGNNAVRLTSDATTATHRWIATCTGIDGSRPAVMQYYIRRVATPSDADFLIFLWTSGGSCVVQLSTMQLVSGQALGYVEHITGDWYLMTLLGAAGASPSIQIGMRVVYNVANWDGGVYSSAVDVYAPAAPLQQHQITSWADQRGGSPAVATDTNEPLQRNGLVWFPGTFDSMSSQRNPTASGTMFAWVRRYRMGFNVRAIMGTEVGANLCYLALDANHYPCAGIGSDAITTIVGDDGDDIPTQWTFVAVTWTPSLVKLYHGDGTTLTECYSGAFAGTIPTTQPIEIGAINDDGTPDTFLSGHVGSWGIDSTALNAIHLAEVMRQSKPSALEAPRIALPATLRIVSGSDYVIRDENVLLRGTLEVTACTCPYTHTGGVLTLSPVSAGTFSLSLRATTAGGTDTATISLDCVAAANPTVNVVAMGDSITETGYYWDVALTALTNVTPLGLVTSSVGSHPCEGHGGWEFFEFRFDATSPVAPSGVIDIASYETAIGAAPDVVLWALGSNTCLGANTEPNANFDIIAGNEFDYFDELKAAWDVVNPGAIHVLCLPGPGNSRQSAFDTVYSTTDQDRWAWREACLRYAELAIARYDGGGVVVLPMWAAVNATDDYPTNNALHPDTGAGMAAPLVAWLQGVT